MIPKYPKTRPDFLANGPRMVIEGTVSLSNDEPKELDDDEVGLAFAEQYEPSKVRHYESLNILGRLYRNIDEYVFLRELQAQAERSCLDPNHQVLGELWNYVKQVCALVQYEHLIGVANDIKER